MTLVLAHQCCAGNSVAAAGGMLKPGNGSNQLRSRSIPSTTAVLAENSSADSPAALARKARSCNKMLESDEALDLCNRAIAQDKGYAPAYIERSQAYVLLGKKGEALADLTMAAKDKRYRVEALYDRAKLYVALRRYNDAISDLNTIMVGAGGDGQYCLRARAFAALHKPLLAASDLTEALKLKPHDYGILLDRSEAYLQSHQLDKALADYNELIKIDERNNEGMANPQLYKDRATVYGLLGKKKLAELDSQRAREIEKANIENAPFRLERNAH